jgi:hypothetical protein
VLTIPFSLIPLPFVLRRPCLILSHSPSPCRPIATRRPHHIASIALPPRHASPLHHTSPLRHVSPLRHASPLSVAPRTRLPFARRAVGELEVGFTQDAVQASSSRRGSSGSPSSCIASSPHVALVIHRLFATRCPRHPLPLSRRALVNVVMRRPFTGVAPRPLFRL